MPTFPATPVSSTTRYLTLAVFKQYLIGTRTDPLNPTVFNGAVSGTPDDNILTDVIVQAEAAFDRMCGTGFDEQSYESIQPIQSFVDGKGWLNLFSRERGPVTAVAAVSVRDISSGNTAWQTITWDADNDIILPSYASSDTYPRPESWWVRIYPSPLLPGRAPGELLVRWNYTGGFADIPYSLQMLIARMATFLYKLREVPLGHVVNTTMGTTSLPINFPADIVTQVAQWSPVYG